MAPLYSPRTSTYTERVAAWALQTLVGVGAGHREPQHGPAPTSSKAKVGSGYLSSDVQGRAAIWRGPCPSLREFAGVSATALTSKTKFPANATSGRNGSPLEGAVHSGREVTVGMEVGV